MSKSELRKKYKSLRKSLSESEIDDKSLAIANQLLKLNIWDKSFYHIYTKNRQLQQDEHHCL